jgi:hypothetical protein
MPTKTKKRRLPPDIPTAAAAEKPVTKPWLHGLLPFLDRRANILVFALILLGSIRIATTYTVFNHTFDEPAHIACGMEWLDKGVYTWEPQHPPLARVAAALGPYLLGIRSQNTPRKDIFSMTFEGLAVLYSGHHYDLTLALARLGILPFYWIGCLVVYWWARRYMGPAPAVIALFLFSFLPPILAHAGLATTDMACTAFLGAAFYTALLWSEEPTIRNAVRFGVATGLAVVSKFSVLAYFPAAIAVALVWYYAAERPALGDLTASARRLLPAFGLAVLTACILIWATYRFSFGKVNFTSIPLPAPELYAGVQDVMRHNAEGHPGYLLGQTGKNGFWYFYPIDLAVKTPFAFLLLLGFGIVIACRKRPPFRRAWLPLAFSAGILSVALFSHINIGIRHVMPIYMGLSLLAAMGAVRLAELAPREKWAGPAFAVFALWMGASSLLSHPDYLPYFNFLAGDHPEKIVVDSDLDWGQDLKRLSARLKEVGAREVNFLPFSLADLEREHGFPHINARIDALHPLPGWNAVSLTVLKQRRLGLRDNYPGLDPWPNTINIPPERIGKGIWLWYFPQAQ